MSNRRNRKLNKLEKLIQDREHNRENDPVGPGPSRYHPEDPRTVLLDPKKHTQEQLEQHYLLCEDIDLLERTLDPDEWDDDF